MICGEVCGEWWKYVVKCVENGGDTWKSVEWWGYVEKCGE